MSKKNIFRLIRLTLFFVITISGLIYCTSIIPNISTDETSTLGYRLSDNSNLDVWFVGDSNVFSGIIPQTLYKNTNLVSYNSGESGIRMNKVEMYTKDMYNYQLPKLVVLETDTLFYSFNDQPATLDTYNTFEKIYYNHDFQRRSTRVNNEGFYFNTDRYNFNIGYSYLSTNKQESLSEDKVEFLTSYIDYVESMGSTIMFMSLPSPETGNSELEAQINSFCSNEGINFLDFNYPDLLQNYTNKIDVDTDFRDSSHLNFYGAYKATTYLSEYIKENYDFKPYDLNTTFSSKVDLFYNKYSKAFSYFD